MCQKQKNLQKMMQLADCNLQLHISKSKKATLI